MDCRRLGGGQLRRQPKAGIFQWGLWRGGGGGGKVGTSRFRYSRGWAGGGGKTLDSGAGLEGLDEGSPY